MSQKSLGHGARRWLRRAFGAQDLARLARLARGAGGGPHQHPENVIVRALDTQDLKLLHWLRAGAPRGDGGGGEGRRRRHLARLMRGVLLGDGDRRRPPARRVPLLWCVLNPPGNEIVRSPRGGGGRPSSSSPLLDVDVRVVASGFYPGARVWIGSDEATLLGEALPVYHVRYNDGSKYEGVKHAQVFIGADARTPKKSAYQRDEKVWIQIPNMSERTQARVTKVVPCWRVRMEMTGEEKVVKASRLRPESSNAMYGLAGLGGWDNQKFTLRGTWNEAKKQARDSAQNAVLAATRQALKEIEAAAKQGAAEGVKRMDRSNDVQQSTLRGAQKGTFNSKQYEELMNAIHRGAVEGVTGTPADQNDDVYEYEEAAQLPVQFSALPSARVRLAGARCMARCTRDPRACHAQRCTRTDATPLRHAGAGGAPMALPEDLGFFYEISNILAPYWQTAAQQEAGGQVRLCPAHRQELLDALQAKPGMLAKLQLA